jgi:hypothetical protein
MHEALELAREFTAEHPFLLLLVSAACAVLWRHRATERTIRTPSPTAVIVAIAVLALYAGLVSWYTMLDEYYDLAEPTISAVAWLVRLGESPYHAADAAPRYAHIYGPSLFLLHAATLRLFGGAIWASKIVGGVAALASLAVLATMIAKIRSQASAALWTGMVAAAFLAFGNMSFWTRPEPVLALCTTAALGAALASSLPIAVIGVGVAAGVATGLKLTGFLYVLPVIPLLLERHRPTAIVWIALVAIAVAFLPFAWLPPQSWQDFWFWFGTSSRNGIRLALLRPNIEWGLYLAMPLALVAFGVSTRRSVRPEHLLLVAAATLIMILAAKPGAGPHHLIPFIPLIAGFTAKASREGEISWTRRAAVAYLVPLIATVAIQQFLFISTIGTAMSLRVGDDIRAFLQLHPSSSIGMGYGGTSGYFGSAPLTYFRPLLVFQTGSYLLDAPAIQEHQLAGIEIPSATLQALGRCDVKYWLIPRAEEPFATRNLYPQTGHRPLFSDAFKTTFNRHFTLTSTTRLFDVYACTNAPSFADARMGR